MTSSDQDNYQAWDGGPALSAADVELISEARAQGLDDEIPTIAVESARVVALDVAERATSACAIAVREFRYSPLGVGWSGDIDIHVDAMPDPSDLEARGWVDLSLLLERLGRDGTGRWAIAENGVVLGAADFTAADSDDPVVSALSRNSQPTLRTVLELRLLQRQGAAIPETPSASAAADLERRLGGSELPHCQGSSPVIERARHTAALGKRQLGRFRTGRSGVSVAVSGVDGSGKSSVIAELTRQLVLAGVPITHIWARPGFDLGFLGRIGSSVKSGLGHQEAPGTRLIGAGDASPPSRSGSIAKMWRALIVAKYVARVRWRHATADGLILFDRHGIDAAITLSVLYGAANPGTWLQRFERLLPHPSVHVYLDIEPAVASARKPDDPMGEIAIADQVRLYDDLIALVPDAERIDASGPIDHTVAKIWSYLAGGHEIGNSTSRRVRG